MRGSWLFLLALALPLGAHAETLLLQGATLYTAAGPPIEDGALLVEGGTIIAVGTRGSVAAPAGTRVVDLAGRVVVPGLVDTHSHVGLYPRPLVAANRDGNESSAPLTPEVRAMDSIWPGDPAIRMALAGGITTANVMPGSGNVVGGQTAYLKFRGRTVDEMVLRGPAGEPLGGMKMANGENPKRSRPKQAPTTRMGVAFLERKIFIEALEYQTKWERHRKSGKDASACNKTLTRW